MRLAIASAPLRHASATSLRARPQLQHAVVRRRLSTAAPAAPAAASAAPVSASAAPAATAAAAEAGESQYFVLRNKFTLGIGTLVSAWVYSLVIQNRSNRKREEREEAVASRMPVNDDELLELRGYNSLSTETIGALPRRALARGWPARPCASAEGVTPAAILRLLAESSGGALKEEFAIERMLLALAGAAAATPAEEALAAEAAEIEVRLQRARDERDPKVAKLAVQLAELRASVAAAGRLDVKESAAALVVISAGSVTERLQAMFDISATEGRDGRPVVTRDSFVRLLRNLMITGQVPSERQVEVDDGGKNSLGLSRSWYEEERSWELDAEGLAAIVLEAEARPAEAAEARPVEARELEAEQFIALLTAKRVCVWGECHEIARRQRVAKEAAEAAEYERNPPAWQLWKWHSHGLPWKREETPP